MSSGFHRVEMGLLADEYTVNEKIGSSYATAIADDSIISRTAYVSPEAIKDVQDGIVGGLAYSGVIIDAGAVAVSGGAILAAIVAATEIGGAGGIVGSALARWLGDNHAHYLQAQIDHRGLLLWVRIRNAETEERA